jgi:hypothetical protein
VQQTHHHPDFIIKNILKTLDWVRSDSADGVDAPHFFYKLLKHKGFMFGSSAPQTGILCTGEPKGQGP